MSYRKTPLMIALSLFSALLLSLVATPTANAMEVGDPVIYESEATAAPTQGADPDSGPSLSANIIVQAASEPIILRLVGQGLGEPRVHVAYRQYFGGDFSYRHIWQENLSPVITAMTDGWRVSLPNLDFSVSDSYIVGISTGNALFTRDVTEVDRGQEVVLTTADHIPLQLSLPFVPTAVPEIRLSRPDGDTAWYAGEVSPGALVPCATYNAQVLFWQPDAAYSLLKSGHQHSPQSGAISFAMADIVPININLPAEDAVIFGFTYLANTPFGDTAWPAWRQTSPGQYRACIAAGQYETFRVQVHLHGYVYTWEEHDLWVGSELHLGDLQLQATLNLSKHTFSPGETINYADYGFGFLDSAGRNWTVRDNDDWSLLRGEVVLIGVGVNAPPGEVVLPFVNGEVTLPTEPEGQYQLVYRLQEGSLAVQPSVPRNITVADLTNRIVLQITGEALIRPIISLHYREESGEGGFAFRPLKNADIGSDSSPVPGGWRIVLPKLDFELSSTYIFSCSAGSAIFTRELTAADVGQTISLAVGADHVPLKLSLPVTPSGNPLVLLSCAEEGKAWHCGEASPNTLVPKGTYNAQVLFYSNGIPYTLLAANHQHREDNDTIAFAPEDIVLASITVPVFDAQVSQFGWLQDAPLAWVFARSWARQPMDRYVAGISTGEYERLRLDVRINGGWSYQLQVEDLSVTGDLELGNLSLQANMNPAKTTFALGETIPHSADQFGVVDQAGRTWTPFGLDGSPAHGSLLLASLDTPGFALVPFIDGMAVLPPSLQGAYQMTYQFIDSTLAVNPSPPVTVVIGEPVSTTISGKLLLPAGFTLPTGGMSVDIAALNMDHVAIAATTVTVPEGQYEADFSLQMPAGSPGCRLMYSISNGDGRYLDQAYYQSPADSTVDWSSATVLVPSAYVHFRLEPATTFDHQIRLRLPLGDGAPPKVLVYYTQTTGPRYFSELAHAYSADRQVSGWTVGISGLTFDASRTSYTIAVSCGSVLYVVDVDATDQGKLLSLDTDGLLPLQLGELPSVIAPADPLAINLHTVDANGDYFFSGCVKPGALVPAGVYHAVLFVATPEPSCALLQSDLTVDADSHQLSFAASELAQLVVQPECPDGVTATWIGGSFRPQLNYSVPLTKLHPEVAMDSYSLYLTKGEYAASSFMVKLGGAFVRSAAVPVTVAADSVTLSLDLKLEAYVESSGVSYTPGQWLQFGPDFGLRTANGTHWKSYDVVGNPKYGSLIFTGAQGVDCELAVGADGGANLPSQPGVYTLTYKPDGLLPFVQPASVAISITEHDPLALTGIWLGAELLPSFAPGTSESSAGFPPGKFYLQATPADPTSSVQVAHTPTGEGTGQVTITVTTVDGSQSRTYLVNYTIVWPSGDVNGDDVADVGDLAAIAHSYGQRFGSGPGFPSSHDLNKDRIIDLYDLVIAAKCLQLPA